MNLKSNEAGQPERQPNSEQKADNISVSPDIGNTNVGGSYSRFKVVCDFPGIENYNYNIGDILIDDKKRCVRNQKGDSVVAIEFGKYPHIFKRLNWWDGLALSEMPSYVFYKKDIYKMVSWNPEFGISENNTWLFYADILPATEEDYKSQQKAFS